MSRYILEASVQSDPNTTLMHSREKRAEGWKLKNKIKARPLISFEKMNLISVQSAVSLGWSSAAVPPHRPWTPRFAVINLNSGRIWVWVNKLLSSPHSLSGEQCCQASRNWQFATEMEMEGKVLVCGMLLFIAWPTGGASLSHSLLMMDMKLQRCETEMRCEWE